VAVGVGVVVPLRKAEIAAIWAEVSELREPMPPRFWLIALLICVAVRAPMLAPWQLEQYCEYSAAPLSPGVGVVVAVGVGVAVAPLRALAMAATWVEVSELREPMPPALLLIAFWIWVAVRLRLLLVARGPWQLAQ